MSAADIGGIVLGVSLSVLGVGLIAFILWRQLRGKSIDDVLNAKAGGVAAKLEASTAREELRIANAHFELEKRRSKFSDQQRIEADRLYGDPDAIAEFLNSLTD